jgi:hypothetical protein
LRRVWFWSGVAATGALVVTSALTGAFGYARSQEAEDRDTPYGQRAELREQADALHITSTVTLALGAAALGTTVALYFMTYRQAAPASAPRAAWVVSPLLGGGGGGAALQGEF